MMTKQSEALRLADALEMSSNHGLRREAGAELSRLVDQRDQLLAALKRYHRIIAANMVELDVDNAFEQARAAIEAAEERPAD